MSWAKKGVHGTIPLTRVKLLKMGLTLMPLSLGGALVVLRRLDIWQRQEKMSFLSKKKHGHETKYAVMLLVENR